MKRSVANLFILSHLAAIMALMSAGTSSAADAIVLQASEPATIYYTTSGADPSATSPAATTTYTNYYVAEGTKITPPTVAPASETISLVPDSGKGTPYVKPHKQKIHESKREFEKYVKEKHGKKFRVERFRIKQTDNGLDGSIRLVEEKDPGTLQLGEICTENELTHRIEIARKFILANYEMTGLSENEQLKVRRLESPHCGILYLDRFVNDYDLNDSVQVVFVPHYNYSGLFRRICG